MGSKYVYECALRWSDLDAYGHVNNARFLTLFEQARVALMFVDAAANGVTSFEGGVVIARHEIDYLRPLTYQPMVTIEMWLAEIRSSRFTIAYELFGGEELTCRAQTICVPFDLASGRPRRLREDERVFLEGWLGPQ